MNIQAKNGIEVIVNLANYEGEKYTNLDIEYTINASNDNYDIAIQDEAEGVLAGEEKNTARIVLTATPKENVELNPEETITIEITTKKPYVETKTIEIKIDTLGRYTVEYDANGGENAPEAQEKLEDEDLELDSTIPTRRGYNFLGWATTTDATTPEYSVGVDAHIDPPYTNNEDITLYAVWEAEEYTITYNLNDGVIEGTNPDTYTIESEDITLINPSKEGYTFTGWTGSNGALPEETITIEKGSTGDRLYTANWELKVPTVELVVENAEINLFDNVTTTFTAKVTDTAEETYQWYYNGNPIAGATTNTYSIATEEMTESNYKGGEYKVVVSNNAQTRAVSVEKTTTQTVARTVGTAEQMKNFAARVNTQAITFAGDTVEQTANIDLSSVCGSSIGNWTPIGNSTTYFKGTFDGNANTINNIYIHDTTASYQGLFGNVSGSIKNVNMINSNITGNGDLGGIAGCVRNAGVIENCRHEGSVTGSTRVGGLVGINLGTIKNCTNEANGTVTITGNYGAGGIAGRNENTIENCINHASVIGTNQVGGIAGNCDGQSNVIVTESYNTGKVYANSNAGGIVGGAYKSTETTKVTIELCYNNGLVENSVATSGGIVGTNSGIVNNCYNIGNVVGANYVGGIVGKLANPNTTENEVGKIFNSYSIGTITCNNLKGGIVGSITTESCEVSNCYYLQGTATGGINGADVTGSAEVRTSAYMKTDEFVTLLGAENWKIVAGKNDGYPVFGWQYETYSITYELNGGTVEGTNPSNYIQDSEDITLINPTKPGYTFLGWTGSNGDVPQTSVTIGAGSTGAKTYTANWEAKTVKVKFIRNFDSNDTTSVEKIYTYGVDGQAFSDNGWSKDEYVLSGWAHSQNATTPNYSVTCNVGDSWINASSEEVWLWAVWEEAYYYNETEDKYYVTLAEATTSSATGSTIKVIRNATETTTATVASGKNITLDLGGKTVTSNAESTLVTLNDSSNVIIQDSTGKGTITSATTIINNASAGKVTLTSGTLTGTAGYNASTNPAGIVNSGNGTVEINGGTLEFATNPIKNVSGTLKINEGNIVQTLDGNSGIWNLGTLEMSGGTITAEGYGIYGNQGTINITNGTINSNRTGIHANGESVITNMSGGTINAYAIHITNPSAISNKGTTTISGDTNLYSDYHGIYNSHLETAVVNINGGTIKSERYGISSIGTLNMTEGTVNANYVGINVGETGTTNITGGTINAYAVNTTTPSGIWNHGTTTISETTNIYSEYYGICNEKGITTIGVDNGNISVLNPTVEGSIYGVEIRTGTLNFYDGVIKGATAINGEVEDTPTGYSVKTTIENGVETAILDNIYKITLDSQNATTEGTTEIYEKYNTGIYQNEEGTVEISKITVPTKVEYVFLGYYTETNGNGTQLIDAKGNITANFTNTTYMENVTLYANWTEAYYYNVTTSTYYATLADATASSATGATIKAIKNARETATATVASGKELTLNLNGQTVEFNGAYGISNAGTLNIIGSGKVTGSEKDVISNTGTLNVNMASEGILESTSVVNGNNVIDNYGTVNINSGIITNTAIAENMTGEITLAIINNTNATLNIKGGEIRTTSTGSYLQYGIYSKGNVNIEDGVIESAGTAIVMEGSSNLTITGGTIENQGILEEQRTIANEEIIEEQEIKAYEIAQRPAINYNSTGTLDIKGTDEISIYSSLNQAIIVAAGTINITNPNAVIEGNTYGIYNANESGTINISDGTVSTVGGIGIYTTGTLNITGGKVSSEYAHAVLVAESGTATISGDETIIQKSGTATGATFQVQGTATAELLGGTIQTLENSGSNVIYAAGEGSIKVNGATLQQLGTGWAGTNSGTGAIEVVSGSVIAKGNSALANTSIGTITIGDNQDGEVSTINPVIEGTTYGVHVGSGTLNFYDGVIRGEASINGKVTNTPTGYIVRTTTENGKQKATLSNIYTVTYDAVTNGGTTTLTSQQLAYGTVIDLTNMTATKAGYDFVGWNTSATATEGLNSLTIEKDIKLYAIFKKDITATFNYYNNKSTTIEETIYNTATSVTVRAPGALGTPTGYTFRGWSTAKESNAANQLTATQEITLSANATYYASYEMVVTATYYYNSGNTTSTYSSSTQGRKTATGIRYMSYAGVVTNTAITIPTEVTSSVGYAKTTYKGIATAENSATSASSTTANTEYYAYYEAGFTYYYYNGSAHTTTEAKRYTRSNGENYVCTVSNEPTPSVYDGASFVGWTIVNNSLTQGNGESAIREPNGSGASTMYAYYQKSVTATFYYYNGSAKASTTAKPTRTYISKSGGINTLEGTITVPSAVSTNRTLSGGTYTYKGVSVSTEATGNIVTPTTANTVYYAIYTREATFYSGEGKAKTDKADIYYNANGVYSITMPTPTAIDGFTALGWRTNTSATTAQYASGATVAGVTGVTYYAVYSREAIFKSGTASATSVTAPLYYNSSNVYSVAMPAPTAITGWTALGWRDDTTAGAKEYGAGTATTVAGATSATYYAVYSRTATFNSGTNSAKKTTATQYYNTNGAYTVTTPTAATATAISNYTLLGWRDDETAGAAEYASATAITSSAQTYYAVYSRTVTFYSGSNKTEATATQYYSSSNVYSLKTPTPTAINGWTTLGWSTGTTATTATYASGATITVAGSSTGKYYAVYSRTATFYSGAGNASKPTATQYYNTNGAYSVAAPAPTAITGWTALGWRDDTTAGAKEYGTASAATITASSATYYAVYSRTATFNSGTNSAKKTTVTQYYNTNGAYSVTTPTAATATAISNYTLLGWRDDTTAGAAEYASATAITATAQTYYAVYSRTATFKSGTASATSVTAPLYYNSSNVYSVAMPAPTAITGWTALGWRDDTTAGAKEYGAGTATTVAGATSTTYYAAYSRTVTLKYDGNGATSGSVANQTATQYYNSNGAITSPSFTLSANGFAKTDYTFSKWAAGSTSGTQYAAGASCTFAPAVNSTATTQTMYAIWASNTTTGIAFTKGTMANATATVSSNTLTIRLSGSSCSYNLTAANVPEGYTISYTTNFSYSSGGGSFRTLLCNRRKTIKKCIE